MNTSAITGTSYGFRKNTSGTRLSSVLTQQAVNRVWLRTQLHTTCFSFGNSEIKPLVILNNSRNHNTRKKSRLRRIWNARFYLWRKRIAVAFSFANIYSYLRRKWKNLLLGACLACILAMGSYLLQLTATYAPKSVPYSTLIQSLESQKVKSVVFEEGSSQIFFNVVEEDDKTLPAVEFSTRKIRHDEGYLLGLLRTGNVEYSSAPRNLGSIFASVAGTIITLWIPLSPLLWLMHRQLSGRADMSKNRKRKSIQSVKFEDVAGVDTAKAELWEIVSCLRGQTKFRKLGAKFPKGVLLIGPPGTGKTLLARALAGEAGVPFFAASASEFVEMFVGRGAARIRELFAMARKYAPSVIFIDELDAVGGQRGRGFNDERDQTLNQLLTEMDGFETERGVLVLAATNRAEALDPALCRAGRFSRKVYVREPDLEGRKQVLAVHMRDVPVEGDAESVRSFVAAITPGFVGADLANVVNEAALLAARKGQDAVALDDFKEAVYRSKYGVGGESGVLSSLERKICGLLQSVKPRGQDNGNVYPAASG